MSLGGRPKCRRSAGRRHEPTRHDDSHDHEIVDEVEGFMFTMMFNDATAHLADVVEPCPRCGTVGYRDSEINLALRWCNTCDAAYFVGEDQADHFAADDVDGWSREFAREVEADVGTEVFAQVLDLDGNPIPDRPHDLRPRPLAECPRCPADSDAGVILEVREDGRGCARCGGCGYRMA